MCAATWLPAAAGCPVASLPCASSRPLVNLTTTVSRVAPNKTTSGIVGTSSVATPPGSARNSSFSGECSASIGANYEVGNVSLDLWWDVIGSWSQNKSNNSQWSNFSGEGNSTAGRCLIGCVPCAPGTYLSASGATEPAACVLCAAGTFAARPGLTSCAVCVAGSYTPSRGQSACTACVSGTYGNKTNATNRRVCALCAAGTTASAPGSSSCTLCTAGTFQTGLGRTSCALCRGGTYQPDAGATAAAACVACPVGSFSLSGTRSIDKCYCLPQFAPVCQVHS